MLDHLPRYTPPMKKVPLLALVVLSLLLAGCGNKGPLVKPSQVPPATDGSHG